MPCRDQLLDFAPGADIGGKKGKAEIGTNREILALVIDDKGLVLLLHQPDGLAQQLQYLFIERVALAGEFQTDDAIADIPQLSRAIGQDRL